MLFDRPTRQFRARRSAFTLVELMLAIGISSLIAVALAVTLLHGVRSMAALNNYIALDRSGRSTLDTMMSDIRGCSRVTSITPTSSYTNLSAVSFVNQEGVNLSYAFTGNVLTRTEDGVTRTLLTNCVGVFDLYSHSLKPGSWDQYENAANLGVCKVVRVQWTCSRTLLGSVVNTEDIVTAKILMRN